MRIDDALLDRLQKMAMIEIDESKREEIKIQLSEILNFVENLSSIKTEDIEISYARKTPLRDDVIIDQHIHQAVLDHAPNAEEGFFIVPKIIE